MSDATKASSLAPNKIYLAMGRSKGGHSRFVIQPFDGKSFVGPVTLGGEHWGESRGATATAYTEIDGVTYLAVGRSQGDNNRIEIYPFDGVALGTPVYGGDHWGSSRGASCLAFTRFEGTTYLAVGRSQGDNSRFVIYTFDGEDLVEVTTGGESWGSSRAATDVAFTEIGGRCHLAVGRSEGGHERFAIYPFDGKQLGEPVRGGDNWGESRGATCLGFTKIDGTTYFAVGRSKGDNSRFVIYPFNGVELGDPILGGDDWGSSRGATDLAFTEIGGVAYLVVGRSKGDNSRFVIYPFNGSELGPPNTGGSNWGSSREATAVGFGHLDGKTYVAVTRNEGDNSRFEIYSYDGRFDPKLLDSGGDEWGSSRAATALAIG